MGELHWSVLGVPYLACAIAFAAVAVAALLVRGDRVLRLGVAGAAVAALPWAVGQTFAAFTDDPDVATRLLRLGMGPIALVGPNLLMLVLGASGQLERRRWVARAAGLVGAALLVIAWTTRWTVPGVQLVPAGMFYVAPGPLTGLHISLLLVWLLVGLVLTWNSTPRGGSRRNLRLALGVIGVGAVGSLDLLLLYRVWGFYPIAWLPALVAAAIALYLVVRTDLLRPQGLDHGALIELAAFGAAGALVAIAAVALSGTSEVAVALVSAAAWSACLGVAWTVARDRPVRVAGERALDDYIARVATFDDATEIAGRLDALWAGTLGIAVRAVWWRDGEPLVAIGTGETWDVPPAVMEWLADRNEPFAVGELATMRIGTRRAAIEALADAHGASLIVPLVDRGELVGLVEASHERALRETERGFVAESARATARALTFVELAQAAAREHETAREVEVADAVRVQAAASRDAELASWSVIAEYRAAPRTTGAGWSAAELADGRLALMVIEARSHGVAAALSTAALTGAFAAATSGRAAARTERMDLDELVRALHASSEGVVRGGEPIAAFLAIVAPREIDWACAGHPGACIVGPLRDGETPSATSLGGSPSPATSLAIATRGKTALPPDCLVVVASSALRGDDDARWHAQLCEAALAGRLAVALVEHALHEGPPPEDLLAVVVRPRVLRSPDGA